MDDYIVIDKETNPNLLLHIITTHFSFEFTTLSYFAPEKISIHLNWKDSTRNGMIQITTEKPLTQIFLPENIYSEIKASNNDGVWTDNDYILKMSIKPPFWWNVWSIILYILLTISGIIYLFYWLRMKDIRKMKRSSLRLKMKRKRDL